MENIVEKNMKVIKYIELVEREQTTTLYKEHRTSLCTRNIVNW